CVSANVKDAVSTLAANECTDTTLISRARAFAIATGNATYKYTHTLSNKNGSEPTLKKATVWVARGQSADAKAGLSQGKAIASGMALTKLLGDLPGNICTPTYLGNTAKELAREFPTLKAEVLGQKQ